MSLTNQIINPQFLEKLLGDIVSQKKSPSVVYKFFDNEKVIFSFSEGMADVSLQKPIGPNTEYHAYSITKTFTALSLMQLHEKELLNIEDPVKKYLFDFVYGNTITIKQLLSHSSGLPNPIPLSWVHLAEEHETFDEKDFFDRIFKKHSKAAFIPNQKYSYSNLSYVILGQIIEKVSGLSYEQYVQTQIISKLNLENHYLGFSNIHNSHQAKGYHKKNSLTFWILGLFLDKRKFVSQNENGWVSFKNSYVNGKAYGGLVGNPDAFVIFLQHLINKGGRLLSEKTMELMLSENHLNNGKKSGMALGWFIGKLKGHTYFAHAGGGGGFYCEIRIYPSLKQGSVIFMNRTGMSDERILDEYDKYFFSTIT